MEQAWIEHGRRALVGPLRGCHTELWNSGANRPNAMAPPQGNTSARVLDDFELIEIVEEFIALNESLS